jgi:hypothetical protein
VTPEGNVSCAHSKTYCPVLDISIASDVMKVRQTGGGVGEGLLSSLFFQQCGELPHLSLDVRSFADKQVSGSLIERRGRTPWPPLAPALTAFVVVFLVSSRIASTQHQYYGHKYFFLGRGGGGSCHVLHLLLVKQ